MADPQVYASDLKGFQVQLDRIRADIRNLRTPTDSQFERTVQRMLELVDNLDARVDAAIQSRSYTTSQIDSKDAATLSSANAHTDSYAEPKIGILPANKGGTNTTNGYANLFSTGPYRSAWLLSDGTLGTSQSSRTVKTDFHEPDISLEQLLSVDWVGYRYIQDVNENSDSALPRIGMIAEELDDAGLGIFVVYD
ncbi:tail fiber domain-containing protein, partial [Bifidobacterium crudilactis]|uniref:tail fiber domain-containing protein n=1 Tax=Bifidobacterium crudilactis TaxID=327277 RepID=UPI0026481B5F